MQAELEGIYRQHRRGLMALAQSITKCPNRAEDAVQTAFCRLCACGKHPSGDRLAYAFAAVRNAARAQKPALEAGSDASLNPETPPTQDPLWALIASEDSRLARAMLKSLPSCQREIVMLHVYTDLTFQQIADALDQPLATVTSRYRRAMQRLRESFEGLSRWQPALPR